MLSLNRLAFASMLVTLSAVAGAQTNDVGAVGTWSGSSSYFMLPTDAPLTYSNGPYVTGIGNGAGGANTSQIETGWNTFGYGCQASIPIRLADDFTVPAGQTWTLSKLHWLSYQTGASTAGTITGINVNIWNMVPTTAGAPLWSGPANAYLSHAWTGVYRVTSTTLTNSTRAIMDVQATLAGSPALPPGTYWVDVALTGTSTSGPWAPPTVPWDATDNGMQFQTSTGWIPTSDSLMLLPQDFPFALEGDDGTGAGCGTATNYCTSKTNSLGCAPTIGLGGTVSASAGSGAPLTATNLIGNKNGLFFHSTTGAIGAAFHGGHLCVKSPTKRHGVLNSGAAGGTCGGVLSEDFNVYIAAGTDPALVGGANVWLQAWSRDPADPFTDSLTDATTVTICP